MTPSVQAARAAFTSNTKNIGSKITNKTREVLEGDWPVFEAQRGKDQRCWWLVVVATWGVGALFTIVVD